MGVIYKYTCSNCSKINGQVAYGFGMLYPQNNIDMRLYGCDACGEVFPGNNNEYIVLCPKCKKGAYELALFEEDDEHLGGRKILPVRCPNGHEGRVQLEQIGLWD